MGRLKITLNIFIFAAFVALGIGVTKASAGVVVPCAEDEFCMGQLCTVCCEDQLGGFCHGGEGTYGPDVFCGSKLADTINGGGDDDIICAGFGNDVVNGGPGDDDIYGGWGPDTLNGGDDDDLILAGRCDDDVDGGNGTDECHGGLGQEGVMANCELPVAGGDLGLEDPDDNPKCGD